MDQLDPALKSLFEQVGISAQQLQQDKEMAKFLYDFIDQNGGIDAVKADQERSRRAPPPVPVAPPSAGGCRARFSSVEILSHLRGDFFVCWPQ